MCKMLGVSKNFFPLLHCALRLRLDNIKLETDFKTELFKMKVPDRTVSHSLTLTLTLVAVTPSDTVSICQKQLVQKRTCKAQDVTPICLQAKQGHGDTASAGASRLEGLMK